MECVDRIQLTDEGRIQPRRNGCPVPLTASQSWYWDEASQHERPPNIRVCATAVRISGPLDTDILQSSITTVVERHEALRTRIVTVDGIPQQHIDLPVEHHLEIVGLKGDSWAGSHEKAKLSALEFLNRKIDLSVGPLFESQLLRLSDHEHVLLLALDHIVCDGISNAVLSREIWTNYNELTHKLQSSLPELPVQFPDYAVWKQQTYDTRRQKHEGYWRKRLAGAPQTILPVDDGLPQMHEPVGKTQHFPFGTVLTKKLYDLSRRERTFVSLTILGTLAVVLSSWCKQEEVVVSFMSHPPVPI